MQIEFSDVMQPSMFLDQQVAAGRPTDNELQTNHQSLP